MDSSAAHKATGAAAGAALASAHPTAVRWRIVALLAAFSFVSYALRTNISIAAALMRTDLHLNQVQLGRIFSAFLLGYAFFQAPAGALGDRFGPRAVLTGAAVIWGIATALTGALPGAIGGAAGTMAVLVGVRFVLGAAEAATYPVATAAVGVWVPASDRVLANALVISGMALGSSFVPPLMSQIMVAAGWRMSFYATSLPGFLVAAIWWRYARNDPRQHPGVNDAELVLIKGGRGTSPAAAGRVDWTLLVKPRMLVLSLSYFLDSYVLTMFVFWFYLYLVDERGFGMLKGGVFASAPWLSALMLVPAAGWLCDRLSARHGAAAGRRLVAMSALALCSVLLLWGARAQNATFAVAALSLSVACLMSTEGPFWSTAIDIAPAHAGTAGGIMNTAGNLGGVVSTTAVPLLVQHFGWLVALGTGSVLAVASALLWLSIGSPRRQPALTPIP